MSGVVGSAGSKSGVLGLVTEHVAFSSGKGLNFNATGNSGGTMDTEILADYEEGTFTMSNSHISITNNQTAHYTKVGKLVTCWIDVTWNSTPADTSHSGGYLSGLPFDPDNTPSTKVITYEWWTNTTTGARNLGIDFHFRVETGTDIYIHCRTASRIATRGEVAGKQLIMTVSYMASS